MLSRLYNKLGTKNFDRVRFEKVENFLNKKKLPTNKKFQNGVLIEDYLVDSQWKDDPYSNKKIAIKIFVPEIISSEKEKKIPILVNIHGGGFVLEFNDDKSLKLSKEKLIVISVSYRLAPEYIFPAALEDCFSVFHYLAKRENELLNKYGDYEKISVIGDSAGGNLSALIPHLIRERNLGIKLLHQVLIYPTMMTNYETESKKKLKGKDYILSIDLMEWFQNTYINYDFSIYENSNLNPLKKTNFTDIPPACVILASQDILYSDGILYYEKLKENKIEVELKEYKSVHGFWAVDGLPEERDAHGFIINYFRKNKFLD